MKEDEKREVTKYTITKDDICKFYVCYFRPQTFGTARPSFTVFGWEIE